MIEITESRVMESLFFAASFQGSGRFVTPEELIRETGLTPEELASCVQSLVLRGFLSDDGQGALQITKSGIAALRG